MANDAKDLLMQDWPTAIAMHEPSGWAIYGGIENQLEADALLACDASTEDEAWENALAYYKEMTGLEAE